jgi:hypothetical protein
LKYNRSRSSCPQNSWRDIPWNIVDVKDCRVPLRTLLPFNLGSDEIDPIRAFRPEEIVPSVQNFEKTLLVTRE